MTTYTSFLHEKCLILQKLSKYPSSLRDIITDICLSEKLRHYQVKPNVGVVVKYLVLFNFFAQEEHLPIFAVYIVILNSSIRLLLALSILTPCSI